MLLLSLLSLLPVLPALQLPRTCIKFETYITTLYKIAPLDFSDAWFSNRNHFAPRRVTKVSLRSKRVLGCCDDGYEYQGWPVNSCQPVCPGGCVWNAHCTRPNICECDYGYHLSTFGSICMSNNTLTSTDKPVKSTTMSVIIETTSYKPPCNESACSENEVCSRTDGSCVCKDGFERDLLNATSSRCTPKCDKTCQNGECTAPNTCTCWPHYKPSNDSSGCHLECTESSCVFGECNQNGTCICGHGFLNNGTNCVWAGDDIFSEPDDCDCWSKFMWQTNVTEGSCIHTCDVSSNSDCMNINECEFYEGYTICQTQIYKCIEAPTISTTTTTAATSIVIAHMTADKETKDTRKFVEIVVLTVAVILPTVVVVVGLWLWNLKRIRVAQLGRYNNMEAEGTDI